MCIVIVISTLAVSSTAYLSQTSRRPSILPSRAFSALYGRAERRMRNKVDKNSKEYTEMEEDYNDNKGFGVKVDTGAQVLDSAPDPLGEARQDPDDSSVEAGKQDLDTIFKKYGIEENQAKEAYLGQKAAISPQSEPQPEGPFGAAVMAKLGDKAQSNIDSILITLTFASLSFCVLCGLAISSSAIEVVFPDYKMDDNLNHILKDVLTPAFTPSIGIFFLFSITFGLFKFAQISSQATVYKEDAGENR